MALAKRKVKRSATVVNTTTPNPTTPTAPKKYALRKLVRGPAPDYALQIQFVDSETGQVITNMSGYTILDQGTNPPASTPTPTTPDKPSDGGNSNRGDTSGKEDGFDWDQWHATHSQGSGDLWGDLSKTFNNVKSGIDNFKTGVIDEGKRIVRETVVQLTGNPDLFKEDNNPTPVNSTTKGGQVQSGTAYNVPPAGYTKPAADENSAGSKTLDEQMKGAYESAAIPTGEVAKGVSYANENATRDRPVTSTVVTDLAAVINKVDPSITVKINSGGQEPLYITDDNGKKVPNLKADPKGADKNRIGSKTVNHDVEISGESYAMDVQVFKNGTQITPASDPATFQEIAKYATVAGFTQIGMGGSITHLGKDPNDDHVKKWSYDAQGNQIGALPLVVNGIKEGAVIKQQAPDLYQQMLQQVARNDPNAPDPISKSNKPSILPITQSSLDIEAANPAFSYTGVGHALAGSGGLNPRQIARINEVRALADLTPLEKTAGSITSGVQDQVADTIGGIGKAFSDIGQGAAANMAVKAGIGGSTVRPFEDINNMVNGKNGLFNAGKAVANKTIDTMRAGIMPAVSSTAQQAMQPIQAPNLGQMAVDAFKGFMAPPVVGSQTTKQFAEATAPIPLPTIDRQALGQAVPPSMSMSDPERLDAVVRTILGEAVGEGYDGQVAVANVIKNRALSGKYPLDPKDVVNQNNGKYWQFSANAPASAGGNQIADKYTPGTPEYEQAKKIAELVFAGELADNTGGSLHYAQNGISNYWTTDLLNKGAKPIQIGGHTFYSTKKAPPIPVTKSIMTDPSQPVTTPTGGQTTAAQRAAIGYNKPAPNSSGSPDDRSSSKSTIGSSGVSEGSGLMSRANVQTVNSSGGPDDRSSPMSSTKSNENLGSNVQDTSSSPSRANPQTVPTKTSSSSPSPIMSRPTTGSNTQSKTTTSRANTGATTSSNQKVTTSSGSSVTVAQKNAFSGW